ncbi:MAG TPA: class I SAM-dependent methyltransferase [Ktedonobacteraceae bacterium]
MDLAHDLEFLTKYACVDSAVLHTALRLKLFDALGQDTMRVDQLARRLGTSLRGTRVVTEMLVGSGVLTADEGGSLALSPALAGPLHDRSFTGRLSQASRWWQPARKLPAAVRTGAPVRHDGCNWDLLEHYTRLFSVKDVPSDVPDEAEKLFDRVARQFLRTQALICASEMDLFHLFSESTYSLSQVAETCQAHPAGLNMLLTLLVQLGILEADGENYRYCAEAQRVLNRRNVLFYGQGCHLTGLYWEALGQLDETILHNRHILDLQDPEQSNSFYLALARYNTLIFPSYLQLTSTVAMTLARGRSLAHAAVLDVGAGSGVWGVGVARTEPTAIVTFLDQPQVLPQAQRNIERLNLTAQARFWTGDLLHVDYGENAFDAIILGQVCHTQHPQDLPPLFARLARALRPDGVLLIADSVLNERRDGPLNSLYFAVKEFISSQGDLLSLNEYADLLAGAGLMALHCYDASSINIILATRNPVAFPTSLLSRAPASRPHQG